MTREPEQVKAFRDTWRDGIHSYLTYLRDRLTVARDLLTDSGSIFVQISDENIHRVRTLLDEIFGDDNFIALIAYNTTSAQTSRFISNPRDYVIWFAKNQENLKFRQLYASKKIYIDGKGQWSHFEQDHIRRRLTAEEADRIESLPSHGRVFRLGDATSQRQGRPSGEDSAMGYPYTLFGSVYRPAGARGWSTTQVGMRRLASADRLSPIGKNIRVVRYFDDFPVVPLTSAWDDTGIAGFAADKIYVVQTNEKVVERCILMTTDPGDLVLDPTCGSGTTAYVAEQWGRRWITIDTSRVALALARSRIMGARYPWYLLADSREGQMKEAEVTRSVPRDTPAHGRVRQGFVYKRVPHITLKSIANNAEIDTIWDSFQPRLEAIRGALNDAVDENWQEWEIPRELDAELARLPWYPGIAGKSPETPEEETSVFDAVQSAQIEFTGSNAQSEGLSAKWLHAAWWALRIARQKEIDASIAAKAETEYLYDQPYDDKGRVRVAGPFTVESLSPHRVPAVDIDDSLFDELEAAAGRREKLGEGGETADFTTMVLDTLRKSGVQQAHKVDRLVFTSLKGWPGQFICAEGMVRQRSADDAAEVETAPDRRAAILVGPEYGTVSRPDLTAAAREAAEAGFDMLIAAAFNFDAHASELTQMGALTVLKARMNPDLHMPDLASTGAGNLFTVFGEPEVKVHDEGDGCISIEIAGIDMYKAGLIEATSADEIAVWFIDTDYNYESFFVRHAYFPCANDPYKALKTTLKAEIDEDAWASLKRTRSRPFPRPESGRVAVKVINHLGDEVMKVLGV